MNIFHSIAELSCLSKSIVLVGGTFDGVHLGHQALIQRAQEEALRHDGDLVVMTFDQHPSFFLRPNESLCFLTTMAQKIKILEKLNVKKLLLLPFNKALATTSAEKFIEQLVFAGPRLKAICLGEGWSFGQGGKGNSSLLRQKGEEFHFSVVTMGAVHRKEAPVSSTRIRQAIASGNLEEATACLGRCYALSGVVVHGMGKGKSLGFPTANLEVGKAQLPPYGVYTARAEIDGVFYPGVVNIGIRPTIDSLFNPTAAANSWVERVVASSSASLCGEGINPTQLCSSSLELGSTRSPIAAPSALPVVEVHLFDKEDDLYGKEVILELKNFLRPEKKFSTLQELQWQIKRDVESAKEYYQLNSK